jgi:hypothetical protein
MLPNGKPSDATACRSAEVDWSGIWYCRQIPSRWALLKKQVLLA